MLKLKFLLIMMILLVVDTIYVDANQDSSLTNLVKERKSCVTLIVDKMKKPLGGGLLTYFTGPKGSTRIGVITNWHVVKDQDTVFVRVNTYNGFEDIYGKPFPQEFMPPGVDIALLLIDLKKDNVEKWESTMPLGRDKIGKAETIEEGDRLFYIGFPLGLGVGERNNPLVRMGYVSQKVKGGKTFLMDGFASHGNSGSPVFTVKDGKLIGVIMAFKSDFITAENPSEGLKIQLPYNAGIAVVITSDEILRIVMELFPRLEILLEQLQKGKK
jgi:S1-C subfamily serine protease